MRKAKKSILFLVLICGILCVGLFTSIHTNPTEQTTVCFRSIGHIEECY